MLQTRKPQVASLLPVLNSGWIPLPLLPCLLCISSRALMGTVFMVSALPGMS